MTDGKGTGAQHEKTVATLLAKFGDARACWYSSVRLDGRAHLAPIWHVWHAGKIYVVTRSTSVRARNLRGNPHVSLSLPDPMNVLIVEGTARTAPEAEPALRPLFQTKYAWDISNDIEYDEIIEVTPVKIIAWGSHGDGRWLLDQETGVVV